MTNGAPGLARVMLAAFPPAPPPAIVRPELTIEHHVQPFLAWLRTVRELAPATVLSYEDALQSFLAFARLAGIERPSQVKPQLVDTYLGWLRHRRGRPGLKASSANHRRQALSTFFRYLVWAEAATTNPAATAFHIRQPKHLPAYLTLEEQDQVLAALALREEARPRDPHRRAREPAGWRDLALVATFLLTGLRVSEAAKLALNDLDLGAATLRVVQGKGAKDRLVPTMAYIVLLVSTIVVSLLGLAPPEKPSIFLAKLSLMLGAISAILFVPYVFSFRRRLSPETLVERLAHEVRASLRPDPAPRPPGIDSILGIARVLLGRQEYDLFRTTIRTIGDLTIDATHGGALEVGAGIVGNDLFTIATEPITNPAIVVVLANEIGAIGVRAVERNAPDLAARVAETIAELAKPRGRRPEVASVVTTRLRMIGSHAAKHAQSEPFDAACRSIAEIAYASTRSEIDERSATMAVGALRSLSQEKSLSAEMLECLIDAGEKVLDYAQAVNLDGVSAIARQTVFNARAWRSGNAG